MTYIVSDVTLLVLLNVLLGLCVILLVVFLVAAIWKELKSRGDESTRSVRKRVLRMFVSEQGITLREGGEPPDESTMHRSAPNPPESSGVSGR